MKAVDFRFLTKDQMDLIYPFIRKINAITPDDLLRSRLQEMFDQNYKCLGIYYDNNLIGICGLWFMTRHYCGRSIEADHVIIDESYQGEGIGNKLFEWIFDYAAKNNIEAAELNTYVENTRSHKFYYNLGYEIKGYHFLKILN